MTDRELMDKAWDYLAAYTVGERPNSSDVNDLVFALESRLAQPKTPDVTPDVTPYVIDCPRCGHCCPQPEQEPVAWRFGSGTWLNREIHWRYIDTLEGTEGLRGLEPLYTAPRPWVGLTDEEIKSLPSWWPSYEDAPALIKLVKDVEAKLKEKNGG
jgi:hypothetical protein